MVDILSCMAYTFRSVIKSENYIMPLTNTGHRLWNFIASDLNTGSQPGLIYFMTALMECLWTCAVLNS